VTLSLRPPSAERIARLLREAEGARPTHPPPGISRSEHASGLAVNEGAGVVGRGEEDLERAKAALRAWAVYDLPWTRIHPARPPLETGTVAVVVARHAGLWSTNPVRLAEVEEAPDRLAVVMATLPGHAEVGEERLEVRLAPDGGVVFTVRARARMAHPLARAGKPVARLVVRRFARQAPEAVAWAVRARRVPGTLREGTRRTPSGWVHVRLWDPPQPPVGAVALVHGIGEHALRHLVTIRHLVGAGYRVAAVDLPGHGRSPGPRGHIREWSVFREAAAAVVDLLREEAPHLPVHLLGHSLGAVVALDLLAHRPEGIERAVALSPPLGRTGLPWINHHLARTAGRLVPALRLPTLLDVGNLAHDPSVGERLRIDPLSHPLGSPRLELEREVAVRHIHHHAADLRVPTLVVHGTEDALADIDGSRRLAARSPQVTLEEVEGGYHELHHDVHAGRVLASVTGWLGARTRAPVAV
jgi:alpha-beta hydrolase superfamily lysophospholipase/uncharacterized protein (UPF0548 family)